MPTQDSVGTDKEGGNERREEMMWLAHCDVQKSSKLVSRSEIECWERHRRQRHRVLTHLSMSR